MTSTQEAHLKPRIVEARALSKSFGDVEALAGLDLVAASGQVTALLGPNGAGKTTFISAVATLLRPDSGDLGVAGIDALAEPGRVRRVIGLAGQAASVEQTITGRENLGFIGRLFGLERRAARSAAGAVLEQLDLTDAAERLVRTYSGGMRRRLDLGASLVGSPKLLLLDEPTTGLDPRSRMELWGSIRALVASGTEVLLTTQYLEEADQLARHIVIIDHGRAIAAGTPDELKSQAGHDVLEVRPRAAGDLPAVEDILRSVADEAPRLDLDTSTAAIVTDRGADELTAAIRLLGERHIAIDDIGLRRPSLDEVFLALTGRHAKSVPADAADPALDAARH
jgi:ABC-2 type transport system ATP-binding protein